MNDKWPDSIKEGLRNIRSSPQKAAYDDGVKDAVLWLLRLSGDCKPVYLAQAMQSDLLNKRNHNGLD